MTRPVPSVSVVMPAYNAARWIGATLESWASQTDRDFEVIVVDDGSSDSTTDIAESFQGRLDIRVLREPRSGAPARPSNVGTQAARGALILPCDADDLAAPERIAVVRAVWNLTACRECLIFADFSEIDSNGALRATSVLDRHAFLATLPVAHLHPIASLIAQAHAFEALVRSGNFLRPCTVAIPRSVFDAVGGYDESLRNGQDYDLFLRIARRFPFVWVRQQLAFYRFAEGNISSRPPSITAPSRVAVMRKLLALPLTPDQLAAVKHRMAEIHAAVAYEKGCVGDVLHSLAAYAQALMVEPRFVYLSGMAITVGKKIRDWLSLAADVWL